MPGYRYAVLPLVATLIGTSLALSGCADSNPVRDVAIAAGVTGGEPKPAPDFVSRTRTGNREYIPVGTDAPRRDLKSKTQAEVTGAEQELEKLRLQNEGRR